MVRNSVKDSLTLIFDPVEPKESMPPPRIRMEVLFIGGTQSAGKDHAVLNLQQYTL